MLKITFYPNDEARIVGSYLDVCTGMTCGESHIANHYGAETLKHYFTKESQEGTIEAQIVTIRKAGAYVIPKLDHVNSIFG